MATPNGTKKEIANIEEIPINNPFIRDYYFWDRENPTFDKIKTCILTVLLVPIRVILIFILLLVAWSLAYVGLYGYSRDDLKLKPLKGWRRKLRTIVGILFRTMFAVGSANWVKVKGTLASPREAPILLGAPHSSFFDALSPLLTGPASVVGKVEAADIPLVGKLIDMAQPIYVCREDHHSRVTTIRDILNRVASPDDWPQIMIFPEGTCTNRASLIQFKLGAFYPGVPIQPVCIRYPNKIDTVTWTWQGPDVFVLIWRTLAQFHNFVEIEFLPVYVPSEEEKSNPKLFAQNVQLVMAKALNLPISDYTFDDCKLMEHAQRCKIHFDSAIADIQRLREKLGLHQTQIEESIVTENFNGSDDYYIYFEEFVERLRIPANNVSYTLFKLFVDDHKVAVNVIDLKEYLFHALFLMKLTEPKIELVKMLFMLYGESGKLQRAPFMKILTHFVNLSTEKINEVFYSLDTVNRGSITFEDFRQYAESDKRFERLFASNKNFRPNQKSDSSQ